MGIARGGFSLTLLGNGKVLAAGGDARQEGVHTASAELYAPASGFWSFTGSMATARAGHTATLLPDGKVLVAGGGRQAEGFAYLASAELYDPSSGTWSAAGSMATPRSGHTATLLRDGKVLFVGGETESRDFPGNPEGVASAELYDPGAGTWTVVASMPTQRFGHAAALLPDGKVLVAGGACCGASPEVIASAVLYDPSSGNWTDTGTLNKPIYGTTATQLLGGEVLAVQPPFAEVYNPITGTWVATGAMVIPNAGCSVTLLLGGEVLVAGGTDRHLNQPWGAPIAGAELFNPSTRTWTATASMVTPRCGTAILLLDGRVLVAGGDETPGGHDSTPAELYDSGNGR
jgi:N-acetylneuraminic acid mutarotase